MFRSCSHRERTVVQASRAAVLDTSLDADCFEEVVDRVAARIRLSDGIVLEGEDLRLEIASAFRTVRHRFRADLLCSLTRYSTGTSRRFCSNWRDFSSLWTFSYPTLTVMLRQKGATAVKDLMSVGSHKGAET